MWTKIVKYLYYTVAAPNEIKIEHKPPTDILSDTEMGYGPPLI